MQQHARFRDQSHGRYKVECRAWFVLEAGGPEYWAISARARGVAPHLGWGDYVRKLRVWVKEEDFRGFMVFRCFSGLLIYKIVSRLVKSG